MIMPRPVSDPDLFDRLRKVVALNERTIARELDPDFNRYFGYMRRDPTVLDHYLGEVRHLAKVGAFAGKVLDLAAGFGMTALCLKVLGVDTVEGLDIEDVKVHTARKLVNLVRAEGVRFHLGDAVQIPFESGSFDGVLIKDDAASHFRHPAQVYAEVLRVLRPGGRLVIFDDRNRLNGAVRAETQRVWEVCETGSPGQLAPMGVEKSFTQMRREYILRRFPALGEEQATAIAKRTRGYTNLLLEEVVPLLLEGKPVAIQPVADCIDPESEMVAERLIDPRALSRELRELGFDARVLPPAGWNPEEWKRGGDLEGSLASKAPDASSLAGPAGLAICSEADEVLRRRGVQALEGCRHGRDSLTPRPWRINVCRKSVGSSHGGGREGQVTWPYPHSLGVLFGTCSDRPRLRLTGTGLSSMEPHLVFDAGMHRTEDASYNPRKGLRVVAVDAGSRLIENARARHAGAVREGRPVLFHGAAAAGATDSRIPAAPAR